MRALLRELLWRLSVCSGTMERSVGVRLVMMTCRVLSAPVAMGGMRLAQLSTVTQGAAARRIGVTCESANRRHVAGVVTIGVSVLLALVALSPSAAFAANNPHTAVTTDGTNCAQCHAPHQAAIGNGILKGVGDTGDDYTPVAFCYGCHDGNPAVNVKTGINNGSFEGLSGHSVEAVDTGDGDLTNVCSDCHYPHADSATRFRLAETTITITLADDSTLEHSEQRDRLLELLAARTEDPTLLDEAVAIMNESGSIEFARGYARDLVLSAKTDLEAALPASKARDLLLSMADFFVQRDN